MSERLDRAIVMATRAHTGQVRKLESRPYILHPMEVAAIAGTLTTEEDVIIAGLLHDVVEDAGVTPDTLRTEFGERVAALVAGETENKRASRPAEETWKIRKEESLRVLRETEDEGLKMLWLSDKLSNIRSLYRGFRRYGDAAFDAFHQKDKREHAWYYRAVADAVGSLADTAAYEEYTELVRKLFD